MTSDRSLAERLRQAGLTGEPLTLTPQEALALSRRLEQLEPERAVITEVGTVEVEDGHAVFSGWAFSPVDHGSSLIAGFTLQELATIEAWAR